MDQAEIKKFLESFIPKRERTIVIVDFEYRLNMDKFRKIDV